MEKWDRARDARGLQGQTTGLELRPPEVGSLRTPSHCPDHGAADEEILRVRAPCRH